MRKPESSARASCGLLGRLGFAAVVGVFGGLLGEVGGGADAVPLLAQRLDDGGADDALDVGAGREVRAEVAAFGGVEGALDERAEDGRFDVLPVHRGGGDERFELVGREAGRVAVAEEQAVEAAHLFADLADVSALVHGAEEAREALGQVGEVGVVGFEQAREGSVWEQTGVFGEEAEQAAGEESGGLFGGVWGAGRPSAAGRGTSPPGGGRTGLRRSRRWSFRPGSGLGRLGGRLAGG